MKRSLEQHMYGVSVIHHRDSSGSAKMSKEMSFNTTHGHHDRVYAEAYVTKVHGNSWHDEFVSSGR